MQEPYHPDDEVNPEQEREHFNAPEDPGRPPTNEEREGRAASFPNIEFRPIDLPASLVPEVVNGWKLPANAQPGFELDDDKKGRFLAIFARTGRMFQAARGARTTGRRIQAALDPENKTEYDPEFAAAFWEAEGYYRDIIMEQAYRMAVEGIAEPVFGGKYKDRVVGYTRRFSPQLLLAELKRVNAEYRDRAKMDVTVRHGVLVVPANMTAEEWEEKYSPVKKQIEPPPGPGEDVTRPKQ